MIGHEMIKLSKLLLPLIMAFAIVGCTSLSNKPIYNDQGYAVTGYDVVAYFTENKAVKGSTDFQAEYQGSQWLFASKEHLAQFKQSPERYAPQYGGYCAYAMSSGFVVSSDPQAFTVYQDKLYLNYSLSVRENWLENKAQFIQEADGYWQQKVTKN
ncbi:YHS domain-containing (seleno)protein [Shewanella sp. UCD-FRSSP16_17]|uniref:YHS domain-containing (seleno)protein n=1 Tax=Shewanella sp. UCD-FRSSP16_17 TaxID=1853256 RepID=UPI000AF59962|nr:YHS domain-containing (seleno)protein [Shewanella sp. UCD-FRSSP16_17]